MIKKIAFLVGVLALCLTLSACQLFDMLFGDPDKLAVTEHVHAFMTYVQTASFADDDDWSPYTDQETMSQLSFENPEAYRVLAAAARKMTYKVLSVEEYALANSGEPFWMCQVAVKMPDIGAMVGNEEDSVDADMLVGLIQGENVPMTDYEIKFSVYRYAVADYHIYTINFLEMGAPAFIKPYLLLSMAPTDAHVTEIVEAFVEANRALDIEAMKKLSVGIDSIEDLYSYFFDSATSAEDSDFYFGFVKTAATKINIDNLRVMSKSSTKTTVAFDMDRPNAADLMVDLMYDESLYLVMGEAIIMALINDDELDDAEVDSIALNTILSSLEKKFAEGAYDTILAEEKFSLLLENGRWLIDGSHIAESYCAFGDDGIEEFIVRDEEIDEILYTAMPQVIENLYQRGDIDKLLRDALVDAFS